LTFRYYSFGLLLHGFVGLFMCMPFYSISPSFHIH
jgi:hypothetical protein